MIILQAHPILWQVGWFTLYTHGLFFAFGALIALILWYKLLGNSAQEDIWFFWRGLAIFLAGLIMARLSYLLVYPSQFSSISQVLRIWDGGLISYGGMLGSLLAAYGLRPAHSTRSEWLGTLSLAALLGWGVGRLGNFYAGDTPGVVSTAWSITAGRVPVTLFEAFWCWLCGLWIWRRYRQSVSLLAVVLIWYMAGRFIIDFWRDEPIAAGLRLGQWVSLLVLLSCGYYLFHKTNETR